MSWHAEVRVHVGFPDAFKLPAQVSRGDQKYGDATVSVRDVLGPHAVDFDRMVDVPAGRVQPGDEYVAWQKFVRTSDDLLARDVIVTR
jgi:hypothetical protein